MFPKNLFNSPDDLVKVVTEIMTGKSKKEALDPVDAKALKGSHADRKDKDIDNDGDVDSSDEYLHNRRKAVKKAMKEATKVKENDDNDDDDMEDDEDEMTSAQKNDMDGDGKNDKKKKKKKDDELSDKPDKIDTKPSMDDARTMMAKEEVELDEETVYVKRRYKSLGANQAANDVGFAKKISNAASKLGLSVKMNDKNFVISGDPEKLATLKKTVKGVTFSMKEDVGLDEGKSGTGYDLYHKDFSSAMKHAYDFAKRKYGITISNDEIDDKVATGPRKPSEGKTNSYRLKGDKGAIQVQVYNKGGSKPFELNMYKEGVELDEVTTQKLFMFNNKKDADRKAKEIGGVVRVFGPKNFAVMTKDLTVVREEVELDEGLAKHIIRGDNYVGVPDRVVALAKQKVKKMNISTASDHSKAMHKALSDLGWQMTVSGKYVREEVELDEEPKTLKLAQDSAVRNAISKIHSLMKVRKISPSQAYAEWEKGTTFGLKLKAQVRDSLSSLHEMSDVQMKKREEIVKGMKKNSGDLKKRYGNRWKDVMYATATKQAMKEEVEIDEARGRPKKEDDVSSDSNFVMQMRKAISLNGNKVNFLDGSSSQVSSRDAQQFMITYNKQKSSIDKGRLMRSAHKSLKHFKMALQGKIEKPKNPLDLD